MTRTCLKCGTVMTGSRFRRYCRRQCQGLAATHRHRRPSEPMTELSAPWWQQLIVIEKVMDSCLDYALILSMLGIASDVEGTA